MLSKAEQETIVTFSEETGEAAEIYTHNPTLRAKLAYMAAEYPQEVRWHPKQYDLTEGGERYIVSREWVLRALKSIKPKRRPSAAQYAALEKGKEYRFKKKEEISQKAEKCGEKRRTKRHNRRKQG